ncbi:DNA double-strand break repair nuclease NurA [Selenihalanaerobacter shriftii]|uniref:NurA domain-containing protein n=1 Tax=Selenihalanaerobacter shriftii TaxID=142842 RepID=A0A1T4N919_9FIRM|nr:DNA double-strand break repair nuclease NurA [Selenihalanaerobacter shriftii]SJZ75701.1 NurA domain-containing protein [Selenihalanaerobacter shriftii]
MLETSAKLKEILLNTNKELRTKYSIDDNLDKIELRDKIEDEVGELVDLNKMTNNDLQHWLGKESIVGVDGSVNKIGSNYPHYLFLLQALAKSTEKKDIIEAELFCPLTSISKEEIIDFIDKQEEKGKRLSKQDAANKIRISKLAELELEVALQSIKNWDPKLIMLDGSLIRYRIEDEDKWKELKELAIKENVLLVGIIEEIGTREIGKRLSGDLRGNDFYDREILFGLLEKGEMLSLEFKIGFKTAFMRTSRDPQVIGIDILDEQQNDLQKIADLVYTLTPEDGRGVPVWLDIVDNEVRISDQMIKNLVETYLDSDLQRRLFYSKRDERVY